MRQRTRLQRFLKWAGLVLSLLTVVAWPVSMRVSCQFLPGGTTPASVAISRGNLELVHFSKPSPDTVWSGQTGWSVKGTPTAVAPIWVPIVEVLGSFTFVYLPLWILFVFIAIPTAILWWRDRPFPPGHCRNCGYDLRSNTSGICPECGTAVPGQTGEHDHPLLAYRLARVAIITTTATTWIMDFVGCSLIGGRWSNWTPERWLGYRLCCDARPVLAIAATGSLALLAVSPRARRDRVTWICLFLSVFAWWWFVEHATYSFTMAGPMQLPA